MSNTIPNPPAYPYRDEDGGGGYEQFTGMTLRDYFAAQALAGAMTHRSARFRKLSIVHESYALADAMLAHRAANPLSETQTVSIKQNPWKQE